jgi:hypothetical protein
MKRRQTPIAALLTCGLLLLIPGRLAAFAPGPGLLGQRTYGLDFGVEHFRGAALDNAYGAVAGANLPLMPGFDAALSWGVSHLTKPSQTPEAVSATLVDYTDASYGKSYSLLTVGRGWNIDGLKGTATASHDSFWEFGAGIEVVFSNATAVNYGIGYSASFDREGREPAWRYSITVIHRLSARLIGVVSISYNQISHAPDSLLYNVGVRVMF